VTKCLRAGLTGDETTTAQGWFAPAAKKSYLPSEGPAKFVLCHRNQMGL